MCSQLVIDVTQRDYQIVIVIRHSDLVARILQLGQNIIHVKYYFIVDISEGLEIYRDSFS